MIKHVLPARKKYQCDVCGAIDFWGPTWRQFSSILLEEAIPEEIPHICSDNCRKIAEEKFESGEWKLPKVNLRGYQYRILSHSKGYGINAS